MWKNHIDRGKEGISAEEEKFAQREGKFMAQYSAVNTIKHLKIDDS